MSYLGLNIENMGMGAGMKETNKSTEQQRLSKESVCEAIRHLQKTIRKGAASNEYMHESKSFLEAKGRRELHKDVSRVDAAN
jgi:hypothetical protein